MSATVPTRLRGGASIVIAPKADEPELFDRLRRLGVAQLGLIEISFTLGLVADQTAAHVVWTYRTVQGEALEEIVRDIDAMIYFALRGLKGVSVTTVAYTNDAPDEPPEATHTH